MEALALIRDAGGEALGDSEPLPPKVEETWVRVTCPNAGPSCGACGAAILRDSEDCPKCRVKFSGEVPWDSTAYRNKEC